MESRSPTVWYLEWFRENVTQVWLCRTCLSLRTESEYKEVECKISLKRTLKSFKKLSFSCSRCPTRWTHTLPFQPQGVVVIHVGKERGFMFSSFPCEDWRGARWCLSVVKFPTHTRTPEASCCCSLELATNSQNFSQSLSKKPSFYGQKGKTIYFRSRPLSRVYIMGEVRCVPFSWSRGWEVQSPLVPPPLCTVWQPTCKPGALGASRLIETVSWSSRVWWWPTILDKVQLLNDFEIGEDLLCFWKNC